MELRNHGKSTDRLLRAECATADRVELRAQSDGPAVAGLELGPTARIDLARDGIHIRLIGLRRSLITYDTIPVTLVFAKGGTIWIDVLVEEAIEAAK
mgnify:CR=1 FL=1